MGDIVERLPTLQDLSALAAHDEGLDWAGLLPAYREVIPLYNARVMGVPVNGMMQLLYYRTDVFEAAGLQPPRTWEEAMAAAARLNGTDLDGDGRANDWGVCMWQVPHCDSLAAPLVAVLASMVQARGRSSGIYFNPETMQGVFDTVAWEAALAIMANLSAYAAPPDAPPEGDPAAHDCFYLPMFGQGRCAMALSLAGQFKRDSLPPGPGGGQSRVRGRIGASPVPGSARVLDWAVNRLVPCTYDTCPFASDYGAASSQQGASGSAGARIMVNHVPYMPGAYCIYMNSGYSLAQRAAAYGLVVNMARTAGSWAVVTSPDHSAGPIRREHLDPAYVSNWLAAGLHPADLDAFLRATRTALASGNLATEPRFAGSGSLMAALRQTALMLQDRTDAVDGPALAALVAESRHIVSQALPPDASARLAASYRASVGYTTRKPPPPPASAAAAPSAATAAGPAPASGSGKGSSAASRAGVVVAVSVAGAVLLALAAAFILRQQRALRRVERRGGRILAPGVGPETTLVITDIQDSTALWEALPAAVMDEAIDLHHACLRRCTTACGGYESATEGDAFILAFHTPQSALLFCLTAQEELPALAWPEPLLQMDGCRPVWLHHAAPAVAPPAAPSPPTAMLHRAATISFDRDTAAPGAAVAALSRPSFAGDCVASTAAQAAGTDPETNTGFRTMGRNLAAVRRGGMRLVSYAVGGTARAASAGVMRFALAAPSVLASPATGSKAAAGGSGALAALMSARQIMTHPNAELEVDASTSHAATAGPGPASATGHGAAAASGSFEPSLLEQGSFRHELDSWTGSLPYPTPPSPPSGLPSPAPTLPALTTPLAAPPPILAAPPLQAPAIGSPASGECVSSRHHRSSQRFMRAEVVPEHGPQYLEAPMSYSRQWALRSSSSQTHVRIESGSSASAVQVACGPPHPAPVSPRDGGSPSDETPGPRPLRQPEMVTMTGLVRQSYCGPRDRPSSGEGPYGSNCRQSSTASIDLALMGLPGASATFARGSQASITGEMLYGTGTAVVNGELPASSASRPIDIVRPQRFAGNRAYGNVDTSTSASIGPGVVLGSSPGGLPANLSTRMGLPDRNSHHSRGSLPNFASMSLPATTAALVARQDQALTPLGPSYSGEVQEGGASPHLRAGSWCGRPGSLHPLARAAERWRRDGAAPEGHQGVLSGSGEDQTPAVTNSTVVCLLRARYAVSEASGLAERSGAAACYVSPSRNEGMVSTGQVRATGAVMDPALMDLMARVAARSQAGGTYTEAGESEQTEEAGMSSEYGPYCRTSELPPKRRAESQPPRRFMSLLSSPLMSTGAPPAKHTPASGASTELGGRETATSTGTGGAASSTGPGPASAFQMHCHRRTTTAKALALAATGGGGRLLLAGLRVRMGVASGVRLESDVTFSSVMQRTHYGGVPMAIAKAVTSAAAGAMVLISAETHALITAGLDSGQAHVLLRFGSAPASTSQALANGTRRGGAEPGDGAGGSGGGGSAALRAGGGSYGSAAMRAVLWYGGVHVLDEHLPLQEVFLAATPAQVPRWALLPAPAAGDKFSRLCPSVLEAPVGRLAVAVVAVSGAATLAATNIGVWKQSAGLLWREAARLCALHGGFLAATRSGTMAAPGSNAPFLFSSPRAYSGSGSRLSLGQGGGSATGGSLLLLTAAFPEASAAVGWAAKLIEYGLRAPWPAALLLHELAEEIFRDDLLAHAAVSPLPTRSTRGSSSVASRALLSVTSPLRGGFFTSRGSRNRSTVGSGGSLGPGLGGAVGTDDGSLRADGPRAGSDVRARSKLSFDAGRALSSYGGGGRSRNGRPGWHSSPQVILPEDLHGCTPEEAQHTLRQNTAPRQAAGTSTTAASPLRPHERGAQQPFSQQPRGRLGRTGCDHTSPPNADVDATLSSGTPSLAGSYAPADSLSRHARLPLVTTPTRRVLIGVGEVEHVLPSAVSSVSGAAVSDTAAGCGSVGAFNGWQDDGATITTEGTGSFATAAAAAKNCLAGPVEPPPEVPEVHRLPSGTGGGDPFVDATCFSPFDSFALSEAPSGLAEVATSPAALTGTTARPLALALSSTPPQITPAAAPAPLGSPGHRELPSGMGTATLLAQCHLRRNGSNPRQPPARLASGSLLPMHPRSPIGGGPLLAPVHSVFRFQAGTELPPRHSICGGVALGSARAAPSLAQPYGLVASREVTDRPASLTVCSPTTNGASSVSDNAGACSTFGADNAVAGGGGSGSDYSVGACSHRGTRTFRHLPSPSVPAERNRTRLEVNPSVIPAALAGHFMEGSGPVIALGRHRGPARGLQHQTSSLSPERSGQSISGQPTFTPARSPVSPGSPGPHQSALRLQLQHAHALQQHSRMQRQCSEIAAAQQPATTGPGADGGADAGLAPPLQWSSRPSFGASSSLGNTPRDSLAGARAPSNLRLSSAAPSGAGAGSEAGTPHASAPAVGLTAFLGGASSPLYAAALAGAAASPAPPAAIAPLRTLTARISAPHHDVRPAAIAASLGCGTTTDMGTGTSGHSSSRTNTPYDTDDGGLVHVITTARAAPAGGGGGSMWHRRDRAVEEEDDGAAEGAAETGEEQGLLPPDMLRFFLCRGLRLRCGVDVGLVAAEVHGVTGAVRYVGPAAQAAAALALAAPVSQALQGLMATC
ncbi:hypothetical protein HYH03_012870 [Edaphochlamys debaryana]|uniref:Guanylate cyclase domain-containing protein n=1 Tax=Edaphochlamys debaryana TaxID=47281 RepID=A0A835XR31_9CHLO|nr:hypothetical protein HYH03_012870 [Edaphochlamys debaryana]|eukprot:KAG2488551.1 hypothetical protein HYH03_012870 [Edaphochlamys debaryana]